VKFVHVDAELVNHLPDDRHGELTYQSVKHLFQRATGTIVVEQYEVRGVLWTLQMLKLRALGRSV